MDLKDEVKSSQLLPRIDRTFSIQHLSDLAGLIGKSTFLNLVS
ncbi:hypothetical protein LINPERHAP1_LOCUS34860 [Linum perenne]